MPTVAKGFSNVESAGLVESMDRAATYGFDFVEVLMHRANARRNLDDRMDAVRGIARDTGVDVLIHLPFRPLEEIGIGSDDAAVRTAAVEEMQRCICTGREVGARKGVLHVETEEDSPHLAEAGELDTLFDVVRQLDEFGLKRNFRLCVENLPLRYPTIDDLRDLVDKTDVSLTIDTGHARTNGYATEEIAAFVRAHHDRISHFHLNDTRGEADEHLPFGAGTIDFDVLFEPLRREDWTGTMTLEINTDDFDYIELSKDKLDALI